MRHFRLLLLADLGFGLADLGQANRSAVDVTVVDPGPDRLDFEGFEPVRGEHGAVDARVVQRLFQIAEQVEVLRRHVRSMRYHACNENILQVEERNVHGVIEKSADESTANDIARSADIIRILLAIKHELRRIPLGMVILDGYSVAEQRAHNQILTIADGRLRKMLHQRRNIDEHIVVRFQDKGHLRAIGRHPFQQHHRFQSQIQVGIEKAFLDDVVVQVTFGQDVVLARTVERLAQQESHADRVPRVGHPRLADGVAGLHILYA